MVLWVGSGRGYQGDLTLNYPRREAADAVYVEDLPPSFPRASTLAPSFSPLETETAEGGRRRQGEERRREGRKKVGRGKECLHVYNNIVYTCTKDCHVHFVYTHTMYMYT